ncbi:hypothetical protein B0H13DRAFT_2371979 [Mycena leptocephala]|nr:hypothetical protein B0H13DRAFT_2371979 [Mycena leptocephala]
MAVFVPYRRVPGICGDGTAYGTALLAYLATATLRKQVQQKPRQHLIPKPQGQAGRSSGYNIQEVKLDTNEEQLEQDLCSNLHALITEGSSHEQFDYEDDQLATSNYLTLENFTRFLVLPFVVASLILEDQSGLDTFHDALFEKSNSNDFGDIFFPEHITEPGVHTIRYQNTLSIRSAQAYHRDTEPDPSPPARHRKSVGIKPGIKTDVLKIRIPLPAVVEEEEITIGDFSPVTSAPHIYGRKKPEGIAWLRRKQRIGNEAPPCSWLGMGHLYPYLTLLPTVLSLWSAVEYHPESVAGCAGDATASSLHHLGLVSDPGGWDSAPLHAYFIAFIIIPSAQLLFGVSVVRDSASLWLFGAVLLLGVLGFISSLPKPRERLAH